MQTNAQFARNLGFNILRAKMLFIPSKSLKIFVYTIDAVGHQNACIGMAQALAKREHRVVFLSESVDQYLKFGFEVICLRKPESNGVSQIVPTDEDRTARLIEIFIKSGLLSAKSPYEKLRDEINRGGSSMLKSAEVLKQLNQEIFDAIKREQPDVIILDHFLLPPAIPMSAIPWILLYSANPLKLHNSDKLPPSCGGFAIDSDPTSWKAFKQLTMKRNATMQKCQTELNEQFNYTPSDVLPILLSPYLNIYGYPQELDYDDVVPRPANFARVDAFIRDEIHESDSFQLPDNFVQKGDKLIYFSLGSMGSVDVKLMKRITSILGKTAHKCIISKGCRSDEYELPSNCWGKASLPQTRVLPLVNLVITHGGNNTVTETFSLGKPMIVMPLFDDQFNNAQRVAEKGFGARLDPYTCTEQELVQTIDQLLNDVKVNQRNQKASKRIQAAHSKDLVCQQIELIANNLS